MTRRVEAVVFDLFGTLVAVKEGRRGGPVGGHSVAERGAAPFAYRRRWSV